MCKFAFVAGATGAAATRLVDELLRQEWRVIGVSRKAPRGQVDAKLSYLPADLLDAGGLKLAISPYRDITHLFFTARASHEETGVEPVAENVAMLRNALHAAEAASSLLEHVHLVEGTKWYGMHLGNFKTPARENDPRHLPRPYPNIGRQPNTFFIFPTLHQRTLCVAPVNTDKSSTHLLKFKVRRPRPKKIGSETGLSALATLNWSTNLISGLSTDSTRRHSD